MIRFGNDNPDIGGGDFIRNPRLGGRAAPSSSGTARPTSYDAPENHRDDEYQEKVRRGPPGIVMPQFLPYPDDQTGETPRMREAYRRIALGDPNVKAALLGKTLAVAALDLKIHPPTKKNKRDQEVAEFTRWTLADQIGGPPKLVQEIVLPGLMDGYSICEKVRGRPTGRGKWGAKSPLVDLAGINTGNDVVPELDDRLRLVYLLGLRYNAGEHFDPADFVVWSHMPLFGRMTGNSDLRAAYRAYWLIDTAWKLRMLMLQFRAGGLMVGKWGSESQKPSVLAALKYAKTNGWVGLPPGAEMEVVNMAGASSDVFASAMKDAKHDVFLAISGAVLQNIEGDTTDGRGDTSVHLSEAELRRWWLARELETILNGTGRTPGLIRDIVDPNYVVDEYPRASLGAVDQAEVQTKLAVYVGAAQLGLPLSKAKVYEDLDIEPPDESDPDDKLEPEPPTQPGGPGSPEEPGKPGTPGAGGVDKPAEPAKPPKPDQFAEDASINHAESFAAFCERFDEAFERLHPRADDGKFGQGPEAAERTKALHESLKSLKAKHADPALASHQKRALRERMHHVRNALIKSGWRPGVNDPEPPKPEPSPEVVKAAAVVDHYRAEVAEHEKRMQEQPSEPNHKAMRNLAADGLAKAELRKAKVDGTPPEKVAEMEAKLKGPEQGPLGDKDWYDKQIAHYQQQPTGQRRAAELTAERDKHYPEAAAKPEPAAQTASVPSVPPAVPEVHGAKLFGSRNMIASAEPIQHAKLQEAAAAHAKAVADLTAKGDAETARQVGVAFNSLLMNRDARLWLNNRNTSGLDMLRAAWREKFHGFAEWWSHAEDASGHEHKGKGPGGGQFTGHGHSAAEIAEMSPAQHRVLAHMMGHKPIGMTDDELKTALTPADKPKEAAAESPKLSAGDRAAAVKEILAAKAKGEEQRADDPRGDLKHLPTGERLKQAKEAISRIVDTHVKEKTVGIALDKLHESLAAEGVHLKPEEFRAVLLDMHDKNAVRLQYWPRMIDDLPRPDLSPVVRGNAMAYAKNAEAKAGPHINHAES